MARALAPAVALHLTPEGLVPITGKTWMLPRWQGSKAQKDLSVIFQGLMRHPRLPWLIVTEQEAHKKSWLQSTPPFLPPSQALTPGTEA